MIHNVFFIDNNKDAVSDFESLCFINPEINVVGGTGLISDGVNQIKTNPSINVVVISQNIIDGDCITALKALQSLSCKKIVIINEPNEIMQSNIENLGGICTLYPFDYNALENILQSGNNNAAYAQQPSFQQFSPNNRENINSIPFNYDNTQNQEYNNPSAQNYNPYSNNKHNDIDDIELRDNPFVNMAINNMEQTAPDVKEKLRMIRREKPAESNGRIFAQKVIALHNQKGGVGKSTLAKELAVAIRRFIVVKDGIQRQPNVCLCDFDLDANDLIAMLNLPEHPNIGDWYNDLHIESKRTAAAKGLIEEPISNIVFTEKDIKSKYLQKHESGIYVLAAPESKRISTEIHREDIKAIINNLKMCDFDVIIIDTGPNILDYTITSLIEADTILAVSTCELISARRLDSIIRDLAQTPGCPLSKIKLVINKYDQMSNIEPSEITDVLRLELYGIIPYFSEICNIHNEGYSAFYNKVAKNRQANTIFLESINALAKKLIGIDQIAAQVSSTTQNKSFWSKLFGGKNK